ncbi:MAG: HEPN domain-containing protein [Myxococcota bacterium]|nr:HEPN domain-containing protein [Myxococcota bacterium]
MDDELKARLVARLDKAVRKIGSAELLLAAGEVEDAISRAYYGAYHAAQALLLSAGLRPRTHEGTISLFGLHFVETGRVERRLGRALSRAREDRENGDYAEVAFFDQDDARRAITDAREMVDVARRLTGIPAPAKDGPKPGAG